MEDVRARRALMAEALQRQERLAEAWAELRDRHGRWDSDYGRGWHDAIDAVVYALAGRGETSENGSVPS